MRTSMPTFLCSANVVIEVWQECCSGRSQPISRTGWPSRRFSFFTASQDEVAVSQRGLV